MMKSKSVAIIGLGYVGLPLALRFAEKDYKVRGVDTDRRRIDTLREGGTFSPDIPSSRIQGALNAGLSISDSYDEVAETDLVIVAVPTPLDAEGERPNVDLVSNAAHSISSRLKKGATVVLESTVAPGTTEGPFLKELSSRGLTVGKDFYLGYSPERIDPGSSLFEMSSIPKLVAGHSEQSLRKLETFYSDVFERLVVVSGIREAEFAKLLENSYRLVNISFVNELAFAAAELGIDFAEVVRAAGTKPYGFQQFFPSLGVGGHCIPVDPVYLQIELEEATGRRQEILKMAIDVNRGSPIRFLTEVVGGQSVLENRSVLIAGLAYKPKVFDTRNSASIDLIRALEGWSSKIGVYDSLVEDLEVGEKRYSTIDLDQTLERYEVAILLHDFPTDVVEKIKRVAKTVFSGTQSFGVI